MLVLSRRKNEKIVINGEITLTVVEIRGDKVRLGVEAPRDVRVNRWEIHEAIQREIANSANSNAAAGSSPPQKD